MNTTRMAFLSGILVACAAGLGAADFKGADGLHLQDLSIKVTLGIHIEAFFLWLKGVRLQQRPPAPRYATTLVKSAPPTTEAGV